MSFIEYMEEKGYKNSTINRKIASISKMYKVMILAGEIQINPVDALKQLKNINRKTAKGVKISLTLQDIKKATKVTKNSSIQDKKISLIIKALAMSGLRISEFINIKNSDILEFDEENKLINIIGKGKKERDIYFSDEFISEIKQIYPDTEDTDYLFYNNKYKRYDRRVLWKQLKDRFKNTIDKDVHPHMLRHFFASHKINVEKQDIKAVSKFLGHSTVSITLDSYVDTALDVKSAKIKI